MSETRKRWILSIGGAAVLAVVLLAWFVLLPDARPSPAPPDRAAAQGQAAVPLTAAQTAQAFLDRVRRGDHAGAGALTDNTPAATQALADTRTALGAQGVVFALNPVEPAAGAVEAQEAFTTTWTLQSGKAWTYSNTLRVVRAGETWLVAWTPAVIHPQLAAGQRLAHLAAQQNSVAVVGAGGAPLFTWSGSDLAPVGDTRVDPTLASAIKKGATPATGAGDGVVAVVDANGAPVATLFGTAPPPAAPVATTLDPKVQAAANAAVAGAGKPTTLVALRPSTGGILAVATAGGSDGARAFSGLYPPGSTFKVVTADAVLSAGAATTDTVLPCPGTQTIGTRTIRNADFDLGAVPLHTAFAQSCNTTFAALAGDLPADALPTAAARFGLAADFSVPGLNTQTGRVPPAGDRSEQVENSIGQGTVRVSPFGMALVSATVAHGGAVTPRLFTGVDTTVNTGYRGPAVATVRSLRTMMREVVTTGRATALAKYGASGKTGTAQFGDGSQAHGWFTGYRGDVAFAVLVEDAGAAAPAVDVTGRFLAGLG
ncbi:penicillin-binding protein [Actinokineospora sp. PR83]|uniref:penicillin-binding transpeptidase domain-containing protein n=1 Tax=Actinokineospora sp. PR83 TaxID=2884908 RepID=UPI0027DFE0DE|nr:penicillin-binding transpeptidase domain-containing protein [Actinokineospora sp. PR83]MCG8914605.1 penicillin-binding protein [Actinokineospora sp. PR83]